MTWLINREGNDHDVFCSLDCSFAKITIESLEASIKDEQENRNRSTHIKHLERALRLKKAGKTSFRKEKKQ